MMHDDMSGVRKGFGWAVPSLLGRLMASSTGKEHHVLPLRRTELAR